MIPWWLYLHVGLFGLAISGWIMWEAYRDVRAAMGRGDGTLYAAQYLAVNAGLIIVGLVLNVFVVEFSHPQWGHLSVCVILIGLALNGVIFQARRP